MLIKASCITNLTDARYFAAKEVDFLGFNLEAGTEGYLDPMYMKAIREWVEGPKIVGEFSRSTAPYIREAALFFGLDAVQVTSDYSTQLTQLEGVTVILEAEADVLNDLQFFRAAAPFVSHFLININFWSLSPENAWADQIGLLKNICAEFPVLLQTDATAAQLPAILEAANPAGLSLAGGEEERVGVKSFDEIEEIFEYLGR